MMRSAHIAVSKQLIRELICRRRKKIPIYKRFQLAQQVAARIMKWSPIIEARNIALFLSFDGEIDTKPLIDKLWSVKKKLFLPVLDPLNYGNLLFVYYHKKTTKLVKNYLNISEPNLNISDVLPLHYLDVLIIPLVAFDAKGQRLGMGGGFYDYTLQNLQSCNCRLIGYAYDCQLVNVVPTEKWDISLPAIATPSKIWVW